MWKDFMIIQEQEQYLNGKYVAPEGEIDQESISSQNWVGNRSYEWGDEKNQIKTDKHRCKAMNSIEGCELYNNNNNDESF